MQVNVWVSFFINIFKYKVTLTAFPLTVETEFIHFSHMKQNLRKLIPIHCKSTRVKEFLREKQNN